MKDTAIKSLYGNAKWIWTNETGLCQFAEFYKEFDYKGENQVFLEISAPTTYVVWVNGQYVFNGQYGDYDFYKVYDKLDITSLVNQGKNSLAILAYNQGDDSFPYQYKTPAITYSVYSGGNVLAIADNETLVRYSKIYKTGWSETLAPPVGYNMNFDLTGQDDWKTGNGEGFVNATEVETNFPLYIRPIARPELLESESSRIAAQGVFKENGGKTTGQKAQYAYISAKNLISMTGVAREENDRLPAEFTFETKDDCDGIYVVIDMDKTRAGYLTFDIDVDEDCSAIIAFGEHLADMRVRAFVGGRNFAHPFKLRKGQNKFTEYVRRIAGRYLMLYVYAKKVTVRELTVRDYMYPQKVKPVKLNDGLKQRIYDVGVRTLQVCIHEHYEDCPGREQALYGQDSRNQMLFGYDVFEGTDVQRESLRLLSMAGFNKKDGLIWSTAPGWRLGILPGISREDGFGGIPNFSLCWVLAVTEYYARTKDAELVNDVLKTIDTIMSTYMNQLREQGMECFDHDKAFNFYEWSKGMEPDTNANTDVMQANKDRPLTIDCIPTAHFAYIAKELGKTFKKMGDKERAIKYTEWGNKVSPLVENFYDEQDGYYFSYIGKDGSRFGKHECTQAHVLFCEAGNQKNHKRVAEQMIKENNGLGRITLSTLQYKFDGIIKVLGKKGLQWVCEELERVFGKMCFEGYTTFPEMEGGEKIFEDAASLSHGWSAIGCYIYNKYLLKK